MISKLILENFTVFDKLEQDFSPGVNVIIGKNGTGKTHILKAIYSLLDAYIKEKEGNNAAYMLNFERVFLPRRKKIKRLIRHYHNLKAQEAKITINHSKQNNIHAEIKITPTTILYTGGVSGKEYVGNIVYIPVKEMLANAPGFRALYNEREIHFEKIYDDIIAKAFLPKKKKTSPLLNKVIKIIENNIGGNVISKGEELFLKTPDDYRIEFTMLAEGFRKLALIMLLIQNGCIGKDSLLLWDEPETNMNPLLISLVVEIMLKLEQEGVQIILATHSYVLLKEFDLQRKKEHKIKFHSLFKKETDKPVKIQTSEHLDNLQPNDIANEFASIFDKETKRALGIDN